MLGLGAAAVLAACDGEAPAAPPLDDADPSGVVAEGAISVASTGGTLRLSVGESQTLQATRLQQRSRYIRWTSSNPTVASVSTTGVVRGVTSGEARITASSTVGTEQTRVQVAPPAAAPVVAAVTVSSPSMTLVVGGQMAMTAVATDVSGAVITGRPVAWSVTSGPAATISSTGVVTALAAGTATVQATVDGVSGTRTLTVTTPPPDPAPTLASLAISPKTVSLATGSTRQFAVSGVLSNGQPTVPAVTYSATGGTVTAAGLYTAPSTAGTYRVIAAQSGGTLRDTAVVTVTAPTVTAFTIAPKTGSSLAPGGTRQFSTIVTWSDGATRSVGVTYSATGGSISTSGLFTAGQLAGTFLVIANCACGRADTAQVVISAPTAQLTSLAISPKTVTLQAGATQQFAAAATWSTGATTLPPVTWSAMGGGNVSASGLYTAPTTAGTYRVVVAHSGGTLRDTATVVVAGQGGGGSSLPTAFTPNLPQNAGLTLFTDTYFGNLLSGGRLNAERLAMGWDSRNATDATAPHGPGIYEMFYPGNHTGNGEGGGILWSAGGNRWRRLYFSLMLWLPQDYSMHSNEEKFFYPFINAEGHERTVMFNWYTKNRAYGAGGGATDSEWVLGMDARIGEGRRYQPNNGVFLKKGQWQLLEFYIVVNSPGQRDGIWRAWVNGRLAVDFADVKYTTASTQGYLDHLRFTGTRGGGVSDTPTPPHGQVRRFTRLAAYGSSN